MIWKRNIIPLSAIYPLQREQQRGDEDVGSKDDDVHQQTDAHEVGKAVAARHIYQHVGRRADRSGFTPIDVAAATAMG